MTGAEREDELADLLAAAVSERERLRIQIRMALSYLPRCACSHHYTYRHLHAPGSPCLAREALEEALP